MQEKPKEQTRDDKDDFDIQLAERTDYENLIAYGALQPEDL